jgi:hypothetical protein
MPSYGVPLKSLHKLRRAPSHPIHNDHIITQHRIPILDIPMPRPPNPVRSRENNNRPHNKTRPIHVVNRLERNRHVQRETVHHNHKERPADANDVDWIAPPPQIKMRARGKDLAAATQDDDDRGNVADLQGYAAAGDDGLESEVVAEDDEADNEVDDEDADHGTEGDDEALGDGGEIAGVGEGFVSSHGPGETGAGEIGADYDEELDRVSLPRCVTRVGGGDEH